MTAVERPGIPVGDRVVDTLLGAQRELATDWQFWGVVEHRDERVFAGRIGDVRLFGITMVRIDMPVGDSVTTYGLAADLVAGWLVTSEEEARSVAAIIGTPEWPTARQHRAEASSEAGGGDGPF